CHYDIPQADTRLSFHSLYSLIDPTPPSSPLFPYTTLFRSQNNGVARATANLGRAAGDHAAIDALTQLRFEIVLRHFFGGRLDDRSEEHTSELQSHLNLVCRLLLEKKKRLTQSKWWKTACSG